MKNKEYTVLQGSLYSSFGELLTTFGSPLWGSEKEICRFRTSRGGFIYMRAGGKTVCAYNNKEWAISGASIDVLDEIRTDLNISPAHNWRIRKEKNN